MPMLSPFFCFRTLTLLGLGLAGRSSLSKEMVDKKGKSLVIEVHSLWTRPPAFDQRNMLNPLSVAAQSIGHVFLKSQMFLRARHSNATQLNLLRRLAVTLVTEGMWNITRASRGRTCGLFDRLI